MFNVHTIAFSEDGRKISYSYSIHHKLQKYFNTDNPYYVKYEVDVRSTPLSIAIIPLLANVAPISWFVGFDIYIDEIDEVFYNSLKDLKDEFSKLYPERNLQGNIIAKKIVRNSHAGKNKGLLFGGGVDTYASYFRHKDEDLKLITLHGADIDLDDVERWNAVVTLNRTEKILEKNEKLFIESNLKGFYTYQLDLLGNLTWWGYVQHALALLGSIAPLSFKYEIIKLYIASSYTETAHMSWGSTPQADETVKWANVTVTHDGFELKRQDKIDFIVKNLKHSDCGVTLRVCYSELRDGFNCSKCEKCFRTILGIILAGDDPNRYGFSVDENIYEKIFESFKKGGASKGVRYFWQELREKAGTSPDFFVFQDKEKEKNYIKQFAGGVVARLQNKGAATAKIQNRIKFVLRNKFPLLYKSFRRIKYGK